MTGERAGDGADAGGTAGAGRLVDLLRDQARACADLGSPLYARLLTRAADDVLAGGPVRLVLAGHEDDPPGAALPLRLLGVAHRLALSGAAPGYAAHLPSTGGDGDAEAAWSALRDLLAASGEEVRAGLRTAPQTNEVGRAAALLGGLLTAVAQVRPTPGPPVPVRLREVGCSAGLNLLLDRFRYRGGDGRVRGPEESPVELEGAWDSEPPAWPAPGSFRVVERVGGDPDVVDPTSADGALLLRSYVWADQPHRAARLETALELARRVPVDRRRIGAAGLLADLRLQDGALTVVQHSVVWQYLPDDEREAAERRLAQLGEAATPAAPLARVSLEPGGGDAGAFDRGETGYPVTVTTWPGGQRRVVGTAPPHGVPVRWDAQR
ncbi:DUF2332 domain-containing protein [Paenibacillus sp. TRM 82003]|uniref:DUF2332 domain-containing protein n=1 Tax=Kineococcus sp. TRM81007 TaxID=2925831 RepID=UPI001F5AE9AC|nr:DUF2332 domain-containing protein [Kineococcus sp. TRM81007]MCI3921630.1 DUF2332 domain-containing protein [Paenibacillus sp. TRM 82003]MCI2237389.1 DUF2332 domain-containing protein [Kineococcus sp. TRM81007]MCI2237612.1 DUF2332 domain-containing protein [Kineococcus sp. TRM81007]MCI2240582.1 DUF2332 domain-containing protein [Kineococcus sp. TRM81007]MCI3925496.1 DUF2332 domain-containing protein [Paenibacillus sp. TRM 82003]